MDGSVAVVRRHFFRQQNRVFVVVTIPRHKGDGHVLTQSQLAQIGRGAIGHHIATLQYIAGFDHRALVDIGGLVGAGEFHQIVNIHAHFAGCGFVIMHAHHNTVGIHIFHNTAATGHNRGGRVNRHSALDAGADHRFFRAQAGHCLTLHVGTHQGAVGIVMLQKRNQRSGHRYHLTGGHVHILHAVGRGHNGFAFFTTSYQVAGEHAVFIQRGIGLGNHIAAFFNGRQIIDFIAHLAICYTAVRRFQETVFIGARIHRQRIDQADVRAFRSFNRAHAAIMSGVHVAHLKAGALTGQTARTQGRYAAFVGDFGKRIGLIHKLAQLAGAEKFFNGGGNRFGINQIMRHQVFRFCLVQTLFHRALNTRQAAAELVFSELAHRAHTTVAQMVDVVHFAVTVAQFHQSGNRCHDVFYAQHKATFIGCTGKGFIQQAAIPRSRLRFA